MASPKQYLFHGSWLGCVFLACIAFCEIVDPQLSKSVSATTMVTTTMASSEQSVTLTMPTDKALRVVAAMKGIYLIPQIPDPDYVGEGEVPLIPQYTDAQWVKRQLIRFLARTVHRHERRQAIEALNIIEDPDIAE